MERLKKVIKKLAAADFEAMYVASEKNIRYLTGFTGDASVLVIIKDTAYFLTDGRYTEQATQEIPAEIEIIRWQEGLMADAQSLLNRSGVTKIAFEGEHLDYPTGLAFVAGLTHGATPLAGFIEELRQVKDEREISYILEAVKIVEKTFLNILNFIRPGVTEHQVAAEMEYLMKLAGSEGTSFDTIVASGIRSSYPHGEASQKVIEKGDVVTLDFGALYQGYASDMTRTIAVGQVDPRLEDIYYAVLEAEEAGLAGIRPGLKSRELDDIIRHSLRAKDLNQYFTHGAGHSIGLDIHEAPFISGKSEAVFQANMVQTIEPGVYIPGLGGIRIEDDVLVQAGPGRILTKSPKRDLIKLPFY